MPVTKYYDYLLQPETGMTSVEELKGVGPALAKLLSEAGLDTADKIAGASVADLIVVKGIGEAKARQLIVLAGDGTLPAADPAAGDPSSAEESTAKPKSKKAKAKKPKKSKKNEKLSRKEEKARLLKKLKKVKKALKKLQSKSAGKKKK